jgi:transposase-like protein
LLIDLRIDEQTMTVTVLAGPERRRRWTTGEKLRIVEESQTAEMPVAEVARRHGIHPNQLHGWRRQARLGLLGSGLAGGASTECRFVPIAVAPAESKVCEQPKAAVDEAPAVIELVLRNGRVLRFPEGVTPARAAAFAEALEGSRR